MLEAVRVDRPVRRLARYAQVDSEYSDADIAAVCRFRSSLVMIDTCRQVGLESGSAPTLRNITKGAGVPTKQLFGLFPKGPAKKVAKISGLGKPEGCV